MLQAILVDPGDTGPSLSMQIDSLRWEVTRGACLEEACSGDRKDQILHKSPGIWGSVRV